MASAAATAEGGWYEMRATMKGRSIECWLDGKRLLTAEDDALTEPGRVGLWTKADAVTLFDGLRVVERQAGTPGNAREVDLRRSSRVCSRRWTVDGLATTAMQPVQSTAI